MNFKRCSAWCSTSRDCFFLHLVLSYDMMSSLFLVHSSSVAVLHRCFIHWKKKRSHWIKFVSPIITSEFELKMIFLQFCEEIFLQRGIIESHSTFWGLMSVKNLTNRKPLAHNDETKQKSVQNCLCSAALSLKNEVLWWFETATRSF